MTARRDDTRQAQSGGRVDDREIGADLVEPLVEQMRHHRRGAVEGVPRLPRPKARHGDPAAAALLDTQLECIARRRHGSEEPVGRLVAADLAHLLAEHRIVLDPVPVAVDDRMVELGLDLRGAKVGVTAHGFLRDGVAVRVCAVANSRWLLRLAAVRSVADRAGMCRPAGGRDRIKVCTAARPPAIHFTRCRGSRDAATCPVMPVRSSQRPSAASRRACGSPFRRRASVTGSAACTLGSTTTAAPMVGRSRRRARCRQQRDSGLRPFAAQRCQQLG
jgi:hypothetical protein